MNLKYIKEYRDSGIAKNIIAAINAENRHNLCLMEVCGTHTMSIFRHGIRSVLPPGISLLSGPGCPVCVTAQKDIDAFVQYYHEHEQEYNPLKTIGAQYESIKKLVKENIVLFGSDGQAG